MHNYRLSQIIGSKELYFDEIDSTNDYATELASKTKPSEGTVIITGYQTGGKGQYGRKWVSQPDQNLMMSVILKPLFIDIRQQFLLNVFTSLAITRLIRNMSNKAPSIKWPNDIMVGNRKICGILIKNFVQQATIKYSIVGIGLNVNQNDFAAEAGTPISMRQITGVSYELGEVKTGLYDSMNQYYFNLQSGSQPLIDEYISQLYGLSEPKMFEIDRKVVEGKIHGIDDHGKLMVDIQNSVRHFNHGEIRMII
jgi:BirA family biotin operon repressor/biotin-[acetyl-CoA-carboxylase] ligase